MRGTFSPISESFNKCLHKPLRVALGVASRSVDADSKAFIDAAGISDLTEIAAIEQLVADWKSAGMWDRTVAIYPFVGGTADSHKWNLKDPRDLDAANRISFAGTLSHSANGIDPDGSTGLANTFIDFNLQVPQYSLSCGYYSRDNTAPGAGDYLLFGQQNFWLDVYSTNRINLNFPQVNYATSATTTVTAEGVTQFNKLVGFSQNGPSSTSIYQAKNRLIHDTTEIGGYWSNSSPASNRHLRLFGSFGAPGWAGKTDRECAFFFVSYGMNQTIWNSISDIVDAFQTTLGRAV